jgi:poly-gamma-glutamate system protein
MAIKRRIEKVSRWELVALAAIAVGLFAILVNSRQLAKARDFDVKSEAAKLTSEAFKAVRDFRGQAGLPIDEINDPNRTGLVGTQYSLITFGRGDQSGVMTAANPNFVAVVIALLRKAGLKSGDVVAVGLNGSLPALNIEVLAACKGLGLKSVVISAVSSGMWGANDPRLTWLDIETILDRKGILGFKSKAASPGGDGDVGRGMSPEGRAWLDSAIARNRVPPLLPQSLEDAVARRMEIYRREAAGKPIRGFINVGNAVANLGEPDKPLATGVLDRRPAQLPSPSVVRAMAEKGVAIINLTDVPRLAYRFRFPVAPIPLPALAKGRLFVEPRYSVGLALAFAVIIIVLLLLVIEFDLDYYRRRMLGRAQPEPNSETKVRE